VAVGLGVAVCVALGVSVGFAVAVGVWVNVGFCGIAVAVAVGLGDGGRTSVVTTGVGVAGCLAHPPARQRRRNVKNSKTIVIKQVQKAYSK